MKTKYTLCGISALALTAFAFAAPVAAQTPPPPPPVSQMPITDVPYEQITSFEQVRLNWVRRAKEGNIGQSFDVQVIQEWPVAAPIFTPEPGKVYVYENTGRGGHADRAPEEKNTNKSNRSVVLDAAPAQSDRQRRTAARVGGFGALHRPLARWQIHLRSRPDPDRARRQQRPGPGTARLDPEDRRAVAATAQAVQRRRFAAPLASHSGQVGADGQLRHPS